MITINTPSAPRFDSLPQLVSLRTIAPEGAAAYDWHAHPCDEFTLVADDSCLIGYPPGWRDTAPNTLLYYQAGERHGGWSSPHQHPRFWVVHFQVESGLRTVLKHLGAADPLKRVWRLSSEQVETFQWFFLQLLTEQCANRPHRDAAVAAWLQLLLVSIERWANCPNDAVAPPTTRASPDVLRLWHLVNEAVGKPNEELKKVYTIPNYDSVRHGFRRAFGCSPREMLQRLRMEHAKNLLLESSLSIKEVAARVGYATANDFNRLFHRHAGMAPSKWRVNPMVRSAGA